MNLRKACNITALLPYVKDHLDALGKDSGHVLPAFHKRCHESANFERYVKNLVSHNVTTWDYLVSVGDKLARCQTDALEVHRCEPAEVARVIKKKKWSSTHLAQHHPKVDVQQWIWIASGKLDIPAGTPEYFLLAQEGIQIVSKKGYQP